MLSVSTSIWLMLNPIQVMLSFCYLFWWSCAAEYPEIYLGRNSKNKIGSLGLFFESNFNKAFKSESLEITGTIYYFTCLHILCGFCYLRVNFVDAVHHLCCSVESNHEHCGYVLCYITVLTEFLLIDWLTCVKCAGLSVE